MGIVAAAFGGKGGGDMVPLADHILAVPSSTVARIQEMHILSGQMLCGALEVELGLVANSSQSCSPASTFVGPRLYGRIIPVVAP